MRSQSIKTVCIKDITTFEVLIMYILIMDIYIYIYMYIYTYTPIYVYICLYVGETISNR